MVCLVKGRVGRTWDVGRVDYRRIELLRSGRLCGLIACARDLLHRNRVTADGGTQATRTTAERAKLINRHRDDIESSSREPGIGLDVPLVADCHPGSD